MSLQIRCLILILIVQMLFTSGCRGRRTVSTGSRGSSQASAEDILKSAIHQLRPENFSIDAAKDKPVSLLNSWQGMVSGEQKSDMKNKPVELQVIPQDWVSDDERKRLAAWSFDDSDATHIRDSHLANSISKYLAARRTDELGRIQEVFQFVVRNIALRGDDEPEFPAPLYLVILTGRGSAEDRAWVCAAILKQLRIDSVIVKPADSGNDDEAWMLGIVLNDRVYLFDPRLGTAIPSSSELNGGEFTPATLDELPSHPEWLKPLAIRSDQQFPISADSLKQPTIMPIIESAFWSDRMKRLEQVLPAEDSCVIYDQTVDASDRPGIVTRISAAVKGIKFDDVKPWSYPTNRRNLNVDNNQVVQMQLTQLVVGFDAPIEAAEFEVRQSDGSSKKETRLVPERKVLKVRTDQLKGNFDEATHQYLSIRRLDGKRVSAPEIAEVHKIAAEDAIYWSALCKFEAGEYEATIELLSTYIKRLDRTGRWPYAARFLLAECYARQSRFQDAIAAVERVPLDDPNRAANVIRIKGWNAQKKAGEKP